MPIPPPRRDHAPPIALPAGQKAIDEPLQSDLNTQAPVGKPVNAFSRAVNPRLQYPLHFDFLMRDLYSFGVVPENWQVIAADEVRLDESGMDVEFTLLEIRTQCVRRRRVNVQHGRLISVADC